MFPSHYTHALTPPECCLAVDTETTGPDLHRGARPFCVTTCDHKGRTRIFLAEVNPRTRIPFWHPTLLSAVHKHLAPFQRPGRALVFHNAKFDTLALSYLGFDQHALLSPESFEETLLASHVNDSSEPHGLKDLAFEYLNIRDDDQKLLRDQVDKARRFCRTNHPDYKLGPAIGYDYWLPSVLWPKDKSLSDYATLDAERTMKLWAFFYYLFQKGEDNHSLVPHYCREKHLHRVVSYIESNGVTLRCSKLKSEITRYRKAVSSQKEAALACAPGLIENLNSGPQLQKLLYKHFKLPIISRTDPSEKHPNGQPSTDNATLATLLSHRKATPKAKTFITSLLAYKDQEKKLEYLESYDSLRLSDILHYNLNQTGTTTGRFSHSNPNTGNIGKGEEDPDTHKTSDSLRCVFGPTTGERIWYSMDYSQLQLRIFAVEAEEVCLIEAFARGEDIHNYVACSLFNTTEPTKNQRRIAKNTNFGLIFGAGEATIDATTGSPGTYRLYRSQFPSIDRYMKQIEKQVRKQGCVFTRGGFRIPCPRSSPHKGVNYIVQGDEAEIVKNATVDCHAYLDTLPGSPFITLHVHDELTFDFPLHRHKPHRHEIGVKSPVHTLQSLMERAGSDLGFHTPVGVERIRVSWADGRKIAWNPKTNSYS